MPRGTLTFSQGGDDAIRKAFLDDDVIECIIDLPGQLFFNTPIPSSLWFFNRDKTKWKNKRANEVLFIDARKLGSPISNTQIEFSESEISQITNTFNEWCSGKYKDIDGFCKSVMREEIAKSGDSLSPGRYIGTELLKAENEAEYEVRILELSKLLKVKFHESEILESAILENLEKLGFSK
jgi:type I restriction enzyme M protein